MKILNRPNLAFYILVGYVFASFTWWALLLVEKNNEAFIEKTNRLNAQWIQIHQPDNNFFLTGEYLQMEIGRAHV